MFPKVSTLGFFKKGLGSKLLGATKGIASFLDEPIVQGAIGAIAPSIGGGLAVAKKIGLLEKVKNI